MKINVCIQGLNFRSGDVELSYAKIIQERLKNNGARGFRQGDFARDFDRVTALRQPSSLEVVQEPITTVVASPVAIRQVSLAEQIGIKPVVLRAGKFLYGPDKVSTDFAGCELAEMPFTNGQFKRLLELEPEKLAAIVNNPQDRLCSSLAISVEASDDGKANSPMVYLDQREATAIANLLGWRLPTEQELERAMAGTDGKKYPDGIVPIDNRGDRFEALVGSGKGTSDVTKLFKTGEGFFGLIGTVWQWASNLFSDKAKHPVMRGGSWFSNNVGSLQSIYRYYYRADLRVNNIGVRFAKDLPA